MSLNLSTEDLSCDHCLLVQFINLPSGPLSHRQRRRVESNRKNVSNSKSPQDVLHAAIAKTASAMANTYQFVDLSSHGSPSLPSNDSATRTRIRRHVMLVHRRRERDSDDSQRQQQSRTKTKPRSRRDDTRLASDQTSCRDGFQMTVVAQAQARQRSDAAIAPSVVSPAILRSQLTENFLWHFNPLGTSAHDFMYPCYLNRDMFQAQSPSMQAAVDALNLLQLGHVSKDDRWLLRARKTHITAISLVRAALEQKADWQQHSDGLLSAIYLLGFCALSPVLSSHSEAQSLHMHMRALGVAIQARKSSKSPFLERLESNCFHLIVTSTIFKDTGSASFLSQSRILNEEQSRTNMLSKLMSRWPPLRRRMNALIRNGPTPHYCAANGLSDLRELGNAVHALELPYHRNEDGSPSYYECPVTLFPEFVLAVGPHLEPYETVFWFQSFEHALILTVCWVFILQIRLLMRRVIDSESNNQELRTQSGQDLFQDAAPCADDLCRSAPWMYQNKHGVCGVLKNATSLYMARTWYIYDRDSQRKAWCDRVLQLMECNSLFAPNFTGFFPRHEAFG